MAGSPGTVAAHYGRVSRLGFPVDASMTDAEAWSVLGVPPSNDVARTYRRLARDVRGFKEGDRVFSCDVVVEFKADQLLAAFTLARAVVVGDADAKKDVPVPFPRAPSPAFSDTFLDFVCSKLERLDGNYYSFPGGRPAYGSVEAL